MVGNYLLSLSLSGVSVSLFPQTSVTRTKVSTHTVCCQCGKDNVKAFSLSLSAAHGFESPFKDKTRARQDDRRRKDGNY